MSTPADAGPPPRAVLAAVQLPGVSDLEHYASLKELERLVETLGLEVVGYVTQKRSGFGSATVFGAGKLRELAAWTGGSGEVPKGPPKKRKKYEPEEEEPEIEEIVGPIDVEELEEEALLDEAWEAASIEAIANVVVIDHEMSPMQLRNLEVATGAEVLDRTGVIIQIFHRHASSREARLQVEIARLAYLAPRLREVGAGGERQRGGIGGKGAGESAVELDRRKIRDRIAELRDELASIEGTREVRRNRRKEQLRVALVGYTNAGKSSLMRALTGTEVLVADRLFATLDTTVRALYPEAVPKVLVSDTVGFIKKLPHDLVASFRSTLDEALEASLVLHVVDCSDPDFRSQMAVTTEVLHEIGADDVPTLLVLNKVDKITEEERLTLRREFFHALFVSAKDPEDVQRVRAAILDHFLRDMPLIELRVPYDRSQLIGEIHGRTLVLEERYEDDGIHFRIRGPAGALDRIRGLLAR